MFYSRLEDIINSTLQNETTSEVAISHIDFQNDYDESEAFDSLEEAFGYGI